MWVFCYRTKRDWSKKLIFQVVESLSIKATATTTTTTTAATTTTSTTKKTSGITTKKASAITIKPSSTARIIITIVITSQRIKI